MHNNKYFLSSHSTTPVSPACLDAPLMMTFRWLSNHLLCFGFVVFSLFALFSTYLTNLSSSFQSSCFFFSQACSTSPLNVRNVQSDAWKCEIFILACCRTLQKQNKTAQQWPLVIHFLGYVSLLCISVCAVIINPKPAVLWSAMFFFFLFLLRA